ncbi:MAG TPA: PEPxxWA-CTERM sorting domain-containing protein [Sphingomonas sp.]|jgi:hypothetical protein|nr:PEPxxWA-CTERM sorting domain-containing protein [Sphingomonas sp.]
MVAFHRAELFASAAILAVSVSSPAHAQKQILSAITTELEDDETEMDRVSTVAGRLVSFSDATTNGRVLTDYGVNKVYSSSSLLQDQTATSAWMDTYTAQGPAGTKVKMSLSFTVDGLADFKGEMGDDAPEYGFKVYAMRGGGWTIAAVNEEAHGGRFAALSPGRGYDTVYLQRQQPNGNFTQMNMGNDARTVTNFRNNAGQPGELASELTHDVENDVFRIVTYNAQGGFYQGGYYYKDFFRGGTPDMPTGQPIFYNNGTPLGTTLGNTRATLASAPAILDMASLCVEEVSCIERSWDPTTLTLDFEVLAGESFTLAAWMYADSVDEGATIDFFNTAKFSGLTATTQAGEAVLVTSASGALVAKAGGGFGYVAAGVPEPASWAMMIGGFALIGAAARRRSRPVVTYA